MKKKLIVAFLMSLAVHLPAQAWDLWDEFKAVNVTPEGRVVDYSDAKLITTSEGQSYGMFFALVANDRESFDKILLGRKRIWDPINLLGGGAFLTAKKTARAKSLIPTTLQTRICGLLTVFWKHPASGMNRPTKQKLKPIWLSSKNWSETFRLLEKSFFLLAWALKKRE